MRQCYYMVLQIGGNICSVLETPKNQLIDVTGNCLHYVYGSVRVHFHLVFMLHLE